MEPANPDLTLIIPAYNEENRIQASLERVSEFVKGFPGTVEVLIVEDGSTDRTAEIVRFFIEEARLERVFRLVQYGTNRGKGFAVKTGIEQARGRYIVFTDTDLSAPIDQIPRLLAALDQGAEIAIGSRRIRGAVVERMPLSRRLTGQVFSLISRLIVLPGIRDTQCGFKAYTAEAAERLAERQTLDGYTFDVEHLLWARRLGMKIAEVPVRWVYTEGSQINTFVDSFKMLRDLFTLRNRFPG